LKKSKEGDTFHARSDPLRITSTMSSGLRQLRGRSTFEEITTTALIRSQEGEDAEKASFSDEEDQSFPTNLSPSNKL